MSTGGLLISGAAVASAAASFGATAIPALIASVRAVLKFAQSVRTIAEEAETVKDRVKKHIDEFVASYNKKKSSARNEDIAKGILNGVMGIDVTTSVASLIKDVDVWSAKSSGLSVAGVNYSRMTSATLTEIEKISAELQNQPIEPRIKGRMEAALKQLDTKFSGNVVAASTYVARAKQTGKDLKKTKEQIEMIQANRRAR